MPIDANTDMDIGILFLEKKIISEDQLNQALERQKVKGGYLSQHFIELGFIKDSDLTVHLTCYYGYSYMALRSFDIPEATLSCLPIEIICNYCVLPIEKNERLLTVALADPLNKGVLEILRQATQCEILIVISSTSEIKEAIEKYFSVSVKSPQLDLFSNDIMLRDNLSDLFILRGYNTIPNRRRYKRLSTLLTAEYYLYPKIYKARIFNISMSGILFESQTPIPKGTQMAMRIALDENTTITAVIEVSRCEPQNGAAASYKIGAFFNFMAVEDQYLLANFLKNRFYS